MVFLNIHKNIAIRVHQETPYLYSVILIRHLGLRRFFVKSLGNIYFYILCCFKDMFAKKHQRSSQKAPTKFQEFICHQDIIACGAAVAGLSWPFALGLLKDIPQLMVEVDMVTLNGAIHQCAMTSKGTIWVLECSRKLVNG